MTLDGEARGMSSRGGRPAGGGDRRGWGRGRDGGDRDRGQSPVIGVVLLIGIVLLGMVVVVVVGASALDDLRNSIQVESSEQGMREVDARLSRVSFSENDVETIDLSDSLGRRSTIRNDSSMTITVNESGPSPCRATIAMGSIVTETDDGNTVAYEGGGVWRKRVDGDGSALVSPPDFQYYGGTVDFPVVGVDGRTADAGTTLRASKNLTRSRARTRNVTDELNDCSPPGNVTISVTSDYYDAWGRYLSEATGQPASYAPANRTASVRLSRIGNATDASLVGANVTASTSYVAEIRVNGTGYNLNDWHLPIGFLVEIEGEGTKTFSPSQGLVDRPLNMSAGHDDMNNPLVAHEQGVYPTATVTVPANRSLSVRAVSYACNPDADDPSSPGGTAIRGGELTNKPSSAYLNDTGPPLPDTDGDTDTSLRSGGHSERCVAPNLGDREYRNLSSAASGSTYIKVYNSSQNAVSVSNFNADSPGDDQRSPEEVLRGSEIAYDDTNGTLDLDSNEAVFIYELNQDIASNPAFNDAIVTVTVRQQGAIGPDEEFALKISLSSIEISD